MDGLLVDTEPGWTRAEEDLAGQLGGTFTPELKAAIVGTRLDVAVPTMLRWYGADDSAACAARTAAWLLKRVVAQFEAGVVLLPGAADLVESLGLAGVPVALVSSSYRVLVDAVLQQTGLVFDITVAGDEVERGKPHPEPYLTAARLLAVEPQECVVLEDSPSGVASGEAAGCAVVAVPAVPGVTMSPAPRRLVVPSLEGVTAATLGELLRTG